MKLLGFNPGTSVKSAMAVFRNESVPEGHQQAYLVLAYGYEPYWQWASQCRATSCKNADGDTWIRFNIKSDDVTNRVKFASDQEWFQALADPEAFAVQHVL